VLLAFTNAGIVAVYIIINSRLLRNQTSLARASAWAITGALLVMLVVSVTRQVAVAADSTTWVYLLLLAAVCTVLPVFALTSGIQKLGPARASIMGTVEPVLTTFWAMLLLNESLQPVQVLGAACILSSVILLQLRRSPRPDTFKVGATAGTD
jgi:drug/metabolite transporter (DMT)-like permease